MMPALRPLAADAPELAAALEAAALPTIDLMEPGRQFFVLEEGGRVLGYGGYELYGEDVLLRSVVVPAAERGKGHGRALTSAVLEQAAQAGARHAFLLTTSAADFFAHAGFRPIDRADAPAAILGTQQATTICATAALLTRPLK